MAKEKLDVFQKLEQAKKIRADAELRAKEIELDILTELKNEKKELLAKVTLIDKEIERVTGRPAGAGSSGGGKRIDSEATILEILKAHDSISCAAIEQHPKMVALYAPREVPAQAIKLKSLVEQKKIGKKGELKKSVYSLA